MLKEKINDFLAYLETVKQLSKNTTNSYRRDLDKFSDFLSDSDIESWQEVKESEVRSYVNKERRNEYAKMQQFSILIRCVII